MNARFITASECPHNMPELKIYKENPKLLCFLIPNPSEATDLIVDSLIAEYGAKSESYYKSCGVYRPKAQGTGSGSIIISSYVMPYRERISSGHMVGIFFNPDIKKLLEEKLPGLFEGKSLAYQARSN